MIKGPVSLVLLALAAAGCNRTNEHRADSLAAANGQLLEQVLTTAQFVTEINAELAKARDLQLTSRAGQTSSEMSALNDERKEVVGRISHLVALLDTTQARLSTLRTRALRLSRRDSSLVAQIASYERSLAELQESAKKEKDALEEVVRGQEQKIATLAANVDSLTVARAALNDSLKQAISERDAAYYVVGTRQELIDAGVLVEQGPRRFLIAGARPVVAARQLDPARFTRIDRRADREIELPAGDFEILSRQNSASATAREQKGSRIAGGLYIEQPESFWAPSAFLIIVRS